jgi:cyclic beta-1,2-glucan synthetase
LNPADSAWFQQQAEERIRQISRAAQLYTPWLLPEYASVNNDLEPHREGLLGHTPTIAQLPGYIDSLAAQLHTTLDSLGSAGGARLCRELLDLLPDARSRALGLIEDLKKISDRAFALADQMDFGFLINRGRGLLSIAYELEKQQNHPACYDLLSSEARIAYFIAIAKDDIPQESWFQLGRPPLVYEGTGGLLSWTGTMFEYLMPALWMRLYPNTLLAHAAEVAVRCQQAYASRKGVPWGISESAFNKMDPGGNYQYFAFGVPQLAIHKPEQQGPVISPYSTFLALDIDPVAAMRNLRKMQRKRWLGAYGFYEALDFTPTRRSWSRGCEVVRCWMAHHQAMSLLSIANFLDDEVVQRWFHSDPRVQATELLLQEKPAGRMNSQGSRVKVA